MAIEWHAWLGPMLPIVVFAPLGLGLFAVVFWLVAASVPGSIRKQLVEVQNPAVAIVIFAVLFGVAIILSAVARR